MKTESIKNKSRIPENDEMLSKPLSTLNLQALIKDSKRNNIYDNSKLNVMIHIKFRGCNL